MKTERVDHIHIKANNLKSVTSAFESVIGSQVLMEADFTANAGMKVSFNPFPNGLEIMEATDITKGIARLYAAAPQGVFAISFKVPDVDEATAEMESMGHKLLIRHEFGEIKEAMFDSKKTMGVFIELIEYPTEDIMDANSGHAGKAG